MTTSQKFDAVVGDTTIVANRSKYVDFTLPYSESGVTMLVAIKDDERRNMWVFLRPLSWDLWLTIGSFFILTGLIIWFLESRRKNEAFGGSRSEQLSTSLWFSFSTIVFAHRMISHFSPLMLISTNIRKSTVELGEYVIQIIS